MKKQFSNSWKSSKQPRKQRKFRFNAPLHIKQKFVRAHLSKELRAKYGRRAVTLRKKDTVKIARGQFKGKTGKVDKVDLRNCKVYVAGITVTKKDGNTAFFPLYPSNLIITELVLEDKERQKILDKIKIKDKTEKQVKQKPVKQVKKNG
ncbi:MAG: 50S ribosomal protein L24 [Candidatus Woesearchaeota archaeon]|jgi:large subunit ribosomal protein L24|nr:50S ribosomal protein L24 [Candidatus Woesearchaeota archaeon]MDP7505975.1 50S ribosomal protein L24 [Candidatus Woesearchaeota archaeon]|tara:strand:+ start:1454 stop:1900 length:447 start_codon:yes stop_codon:yes gene_type:complete